MTVPDPRNEDPYADAPIPPPDESDEPEAGGKKKDGPSIAKLLVEMAEEQYRLVRSTDDRAYVVPKDGPSLAIPLGSKRGLKLRLAASLHRRTGLVPGGSALSDCITILEGEAADLPRQDVHLRVARHQDSIVLDLGTATGHVAEITPDGWSIQATSPVVFRRSSLSNPFLDPTPGGTLDELRALLNLTEADFHLAIGWVVAGYFPDIPHPLLFVQSEQGTGKTDLVRALLALIDPPAAAERSIPPGEREWAIFARASWAFAYDNVTELPDWFSNSLCKGSTGDAVLQRELHSDEDIIIFAFQRVIALTTIALAHEPADDLADRMLLLEPEVIEHRLTRAEVAARQHAALPGAHGAILDLVAKVLQHLPKVTVAHPTRMADFMHILAALDTATRWNTLTDYRAKVFAVGMRLIENTGLARALYYLAGPTPSDTAVWQGTASDLIAVLGQIATSRDLPDRDLPTDYRQMGIRLQQIAPSLRKAGIDIRKGKRSNTARRYEIYKRAPVGPQPQPSTTETQ